MPAATVDRLDDAERVHRRRHARAAQRRHDAGMDVGQQQPVAQGFPADQYAGIHRLDHVGDLADDQHQVVARLDGAGQNTFHRGAFRHRVTGLNAGGDRVKFEQGERGGSH
jgi:hypothetical protein